MVVLPTAMSARLFFSYSHKDEVVREELEKNLVMLKNEGAIEVWHDRRIVAGDDWAGDISDNLEKADIILLMVSHHFLASKYISENELPRALERHAARQTRVIPVILESCDWDHPPLNTLQSATKDAKPIDKYENTQVALMEVVRAIRKAVRSGPDNVMQSIPLEDDGRVVPEDLPYLINRDPHIGRFADRLEAALRKTPRSPLVVVIYGHPEGAHQKLVSRLLFGDEVRVPLRKAHVVIHRKIDEKASEAELRKGLCEHFQAEGKKLEEHIARLASGLDGVQLLAVETIFRTSELSRSDFPVIDQFLNYWNSISLPPELQVAVFVCIKTDATPRRSLLARLLARPTLVDLGKEIAKQYSRHPHVLVLEELSRVKLGDLDRWRYKPRVQQFLQAARIDLTERFIKTIFREQEEDHLEPVAIRIDERLIGPTRTIRR